MKLDITYKSYKEYIKLINIRCLNELLICIPTFNSYELTCNAIENFYKQKDINFDILIIGSSNDIFDILKKYPKINYCLTNDNYGGCGNFLLSLYISNANKYKFTMLSDNDALIIGNSSLKKMLNYLLSNNFLAVLTSTFPCTMHCALYSNKIFNELNYFFNSNYFLPFGDTAFDKRLEFYLPGKVGICNVSHTHPKKWEKLCFSQKNAFLWIRGILIYLFREKFPLRLKLSISYFRPCIFYLAFFLIQYRLDFFKLFYQALKQVYLDSYNFDFYNNINEKILYQSLSEDEVKSNFEVVKFHNMQNPIEGLLRPSFFKYIDSDRSTKYFKKI